MESGLTHPFSGFLCKPKRSKSNKHKTKTKKKSNKKTPKTHQTRAGLGEVGPKEKAKITKGDLKD